MSLGVSYSIKEQFFDREAVQRELKARGMQGLGRIGWFIRQQARKSQKQFGEARKPPKNLTGKVAARRAREARNRPASAPGKPPHAHSGNPIATLRNILYGFDRFAGSVLVGPVALNKKQYLNGKLSAGTIPALHEFGGTAGIREKQVGKTWRPMGRRKPRPGQATRIRLARYPARPYMQPALAKAREKFKTIWYGSISGAA